MPFYNKKISFIQDDGEAFLQFSENGFTSGDKMFLWEDFIKKYRILFSRRENSISKRDSIVGEIEKIFERDQLFYRETFFEEFAFLMALHPLLKDVFSKPRQTEIIESDIRNLYLWNKIKPARK